MTQKNYLEHRVVVYPRIVPIKLSTRLAKAGLHTTYDVHEAIRGGNLCGYKGIGPRTEEKILMYYTYPLDLMRLR